ncbi:MAG: signal peptidase II [Deltaproteobacteria bacterium]|nr:signal peptidase II [Deltaproteobacteria bacterium]
MVWPALVIALLDQLTKWAVVETLNRYESVSVINGFFNLVHVRNRGMAFGLMNRPDVNFGFYVLTAGSVVAIVLLLAWFFKIKEDAYRIIPGLSLILGGAFGNLIDRLRFREVIDFLDFYVGPYHWPAFNVADAAITTGVCWVAFHFVFSKDASS